jgi:hypothetical protein
MIPLQADEEQSDWEWKEERQHRHHDGQGAETGQGADTRGNERQEDQQDYLVHLFHYTILPTTQAVRAVRTTTSQGGHFQNASTRKAASASATSTAVKMALVQTGW